MKITFSILIASTLLITSCEDKHDPRILFVRPDGSAFSTNPVEIYLDRSLTKSEEIVHIYTTDDKTLRSVIGYKEVNDGAKEELVLQEFAVFSDDSSNGTTKHTYRVTSDSTVAINNQIPKYSAGDEIILSVEAEDGASNVTTASIKLVIK